jgi:hypothetical protein
VLAQPFEHLRGDIREIVPVIIALQEALDALSLFLCLFGEFWLLLFGGFKLRRIIPGPGRLRAL